LKKARKIEYRVVREDRLLPAPGGHPEKNKELKNTVYGKIWPVADAVADSNADSGHFLLRIDCRWNDYEHIGYRNIL
jgi:hypothetical protein